MFTKMFLYVVVVYSTFYSTSKTDTSLLIYREIRGYALNLITSSMVISFSQQS